MHHRQDRARFTSQFEDGFIRTQARQAIPAMAANREDVGFARQVLPEINEWASGMSLIVDTLKVYMPVSFSQCRKGAKRASDKRTSGAGLAVPFGCGEKSFA